MWLKLHDTAVYDNTHSHSAAATTAAVRQLKFELPLKLPYSPDLHPLDYRVFGQLKKTSVDVLTSVNEIKNVVLTCLRS